MKPTVMAVAEHNELSTQEQRALEACEQDINKGGELVARALQKIRDERLYRAEFDTFEEYCQSRLNRSRQWASLQIMRIQVIENIANAEPSLSTIVDKLPESATREISDLPPKQQSEVIKRVVDTGKKPTAENVKQARKEVAPKPESVADHEPTTNAVVDHKTDSVSDNAQLDSIGRAVPEHLKEHAANAAKITALRNLLTQFKKEFNKVKKLPGGEYIGQGLEIDALDANLKGSRYWTACPSCDADGCNGCRGFGYLRHGVNLSDAMREKIRSQGGQI